MEMQLTLKKLHNIPKTLLPIALTLLILSVVPLHNHPFLIRYPTTPNNSSSDLEPSPSYQPSAESQEDEAIKIASSSEFTPPPYYHQSAESNGDEAMKVASSSELGVAPPPNYYPSADQSHEDEAGKKIAHKQTTCDIFTGEWIPNPQAPYYTNMTCSAIQNQQNCMKYGRPDTEFMKWRWKPDGCELPLFDPNQFMELARGKSLAFVGDSVARNHMQSLICLLSRVAYPVAVLDAWGNENKLYEFRDYNLKISMYWAPYLVRAERTDPNDVTRPFNLYLDEFDEDWRTKIKTYDYVIISGGHWFARPAYFYVNGSLAGCQYCPKENVTHLQTSFSYRRAFRTAFRAINSLKNFKGMTFLRTLSPSHFENGPWDKGGDCVRTKPFKRNETSLEDYNHLEMHMIQLQELQIAQEEGRKKGLRFRLLDATKPMLLRPDGHPSKYGHWSQENVPLPHDCVHWCLPGPIDVLNDFLLELLKREDPAAR